MTDEIYRSVAAPVENQIKVRGSRFIASVFPVSIPQEADEHLQSVRKHYFDATHHCFAYTIGNTKDAVRFSDAGEPSGTAGQKILSAIRSKDLSDVLVVVTRYFGGTKLGVGGLGRAYFDSASTGLDGCVIIQKHVVQEFTVRFLFNDTNPVMNLVAKNEVKIDSTKYTADETVLTLMVSPSRIQFMSDALMNATQGRVSLSVGELKTIIL